MQQDPDIIYYDPFIREVEGGMESIRDAIMERTALKQTKAVENGRVYVASWRSGSGIYQILGFLYMAKCLHPDLFEDIDPCKVKEELIELIFGDEDHALILKNFNPWEKPYLKLFINYLTFSLKNTKLSLVYPFGVLIVIQVNTHEAKTKLSYLLSKVEEEHEKIRICRNGKPVAVLIPIGDISSPLKQHSKLMGVRFHEDPTAPLSDDDWPEELK